MSAGCVQEEALHCRLPQCVPSVCGEYQRAEGCKNLRHASAVVFLSGDETLKVVALELVLPPTTPGGEKKSRVFTPLERLLHCLNICMAMRQGSRCKQRHRCSPSFQSLLVIRGKQ